MRRGINMQKTSIIILTYNNLEYNKQCIESIRRFSGENSYEIVVVDNNSTDGTVEWLKDQHDIKTIFNKENVGFPKGCNQGIELADEENDILLLNNDTIVTPNWLKNLATCLYSSKVIGAVGAVTNSCSYYQAIATTYSNIEEMISFAQSYNDSDESKWEQRVKLVGFCMLIKRSVINKVGLLDTRFSPGNFEDDDLSFRIINAGYKLMLCKDTFIHHYGSTSFKANPARFYKLLEENSKKFEEKWGFNSTYSTNIRHDIIEIIKENVHKEINVLEVGCAAGATLLKIKDIYRNADIYGIELNKHSAEIAKSFADIRAENVENINLSYEEQFFDYIIFADVLEHLYDPWEVVNNIRKYLKPRGKLIASIPNIMHYSVLSDLINGNWTYQNAGILDKTHIRFFTLNEINKMFIDCGYSKLQYSAITLGTTENDEDFINKLCSISANMDKRQYLTYQYIVKAEKEVMKFRDISDEEYNNVKYIIRRIENNIDVEKNLDNLFDLILRGKINENHLETIILEDMINKEQLLNIIALAACIKDKIQMSLHFLNLAYDLNCFNEETIYNIAYVTYYLLGKKDVALKFIDDSNIKSESILMLKKEILGD
jgi:O-antigen biosynthesis protein